MMSRDATALLDADGALAVEDERALTAVLTRWIESPDDRRAAGQTARAVVQRGLGAAERSDALVAGLLG
jgi:3-deoxy-D-manno-octulosonic-acid transferase